MSDITHFQELFDLDVSEHVEVKDRSGVKLSYLSWAWAWAEFKKRYPEATYQVQMFGDLPYTVDASTGIMVFTSVTVDGITHQMWLPVMDGANKAMRLEPYTCKVFDGQARTWKDKTVAAATMFDINKAIMRCLVKNLAMFGLGLRIYAGEDFPAPVEEVPDATETKTRKTSKKGTKTASAASTEPTPEEFPAAEEKPVPADIWGRLVAAQAQGKRANGQTPREYLLANYAPSDLRLASFDDAVADYKINNSIK